MGSVDVQTGDRRKDDCSYRRVKIRVGLIIVYIVWDLVPWIHLQGERIMEGERESIPKSTCGPTGVGPSMK